MKRIVFSEEAKADIRAIPQHIAMNILTAIHRLAEHGSMARRMRTSHGFHSSSMDPVLAEFEQILAGQIRALAVTVDHRVPALASIPTMAEAGVAGYETAGWFGLLAPAQTPTPIVARLAQAVAAILAAPDMQQRLLALGTEPMPLGPAEFGAFIRAELPRWAAIVQRSGAQVD